MADVVLDEIARLEAQVKALRERIYDLRKLRSQPSVVPVLVYWRYGGERREPEELYDDGRTPLEQAYGHLSAMLDEGQSSPVGVEVNGVLLPFDELADRFELAA